MVLFPPPFYFVFYISNLLSYIQNNFSYELARPIMGTIFLVYFCCLVLCETCHCFGSFSIMSFHIFIVVFNVPFDFCVQFYNNS